jgi:hypothetical protein
MRREKDKELRRRQHRRRKLKKLKAELAQTSDPIQRDYLIEKIKKISIYPSKDLS